MASNTVFWSDEDNGYIAQDGRTGISAFGETKEQAKAQLKVVMGTVNDIFREDGDSTPYKPGPIKLWIDEVERKPLVD